MSDVLQNALGRARSAMSGFTPGQIGVIAVAIAALVAAGIFFSRWSAAPLSPLFSNLASADAAKVVQELDSTGVTYQLEDGEDGLELHIDAVGPGERVLVVDDLLATGGTAEAVGKLVTRQGAELVGYAFVVELAFLHGARRLGAERIDSLVTF